MQKWDDQTESTMRRKEKIEFFRRCECERTETHESYLQRHDRSIYKLRYSSDRKSPAFLEVFLRVLHRRSARNRQSRVSKNAKGGKGRKNTREKQWFKAFEGVDESDAERGHERREQS